MGKSWVCCIRKACFIRCDQVEGFFVERMQSFASGYLVQIMTPILYAAFTCILALGGAAVGTIVGAIKGQTTETGFVKGSAIGAIAGAITALQFLGSKSDHDQPLSKVFMEWVSLAVLEAYQWQISTMETTFTEISDIYDTNGNKKELSNTCIQKLPHFTFHSINNSHLHYHNSCCSVCLQEFKDGDLMRKVPYCEHSFHLDCLDKWLSIKASCPICRNNINISDYSLVF